MFKRSRTAWGIDLGHRTLRAVKLRSQGTTVTLEQFEAIPYEGIEPDPDSMERARHVRNALTEFIKRGKPKGSAIAVAIPGRSAFTRTIPLPPVEEKRIPSIVKYEAQQLIPFPIDEVVWDYQRLAKAGAPDELEVTLFAVKTQIIYSFLANIKATKLHVDLIQVAPLALYNFVQFEQQPEGSIVVVDIGAGNADLVLLDGERFWNRSIPYSGDDITKALQEKFQISFDEAEELKLKASESQQADKLFNVMKPVLGDIVSEIHRSIGYYKSQAHNVKFERMLLLGNAFRLKGADDFFGQHLDYNLAVLDQLERIQYAPALDNDKLQEELRSCGVALGLALQALDIGPIKINLVPKEERIEKLISRKKPYGAAAAAILAMMVGSSYYMNNKTRDVIGDAVKRVPQVITVCKSDEQRYNDIKNEAIPAVDGDQGINKVIGLGLGREYWPFIFNQLDRAIPRENHWMVTFKTVDTKEMPGGSAPGGMGGASAFGGGGGAGPAPRAVAAATASDSSESIGFELVVDILVPEGVNEGRIVTSLTDAGGIESNLKNVPIFENVKRLEVQTVSQEVGLLRAKEGAEKKEDNAASGGAAAAKPSAPPGGAGGLPGGLPGALPGGLPAGGVGAGRAMPEPGPVSGGSDTEVVYKEKLNFLRVKFIWAVKTQAKLNASEAWWSVVVQMVEDAVKEQQYPSAMETLWNYQLTSPDLGGDKLKKKVVELLVALEPQLRETPQYPQCLDMLKRLAPGQLPKPKQAAHPATPAATATPAAPASPALGVVQP
ncbi:MAG: type IV pilus assembly protein PilM [Planctomycetes bacterium]|nr:type IV pilus assembly protein PilM [Planctomycetota bacterium]